VSGQLIEVRLPTRTVVSKIQLDYPSQLKSGWRRTVRAEDLKFQWVRLLDDSSRTISLNNFDFLKSAYGRKIFPLEGNHPKLPTGQVSLMPIDHALVDSTLKTTDGETLFSYGDIALQQGQSLEAKHSWFVGICQKLTESLTKTDPEGSYVKIIVTRDNLVLDSLRAITSLSPDDMRRNWKISFLNEPAIDEEGVTREWFHCLTERLFDPRFGLFQANEHNQAAVDINPASGTCSVVAGDKKNLFLSHALMSFTFSISRHRLP
jgi:hypothetical protein